MMRFASFGRVVYYFIFSGSYDIIIMSMVFVDDTDVSSLSSSWADDLPKTASTPRVGVRFAYPLVGIHGLLYITLLF